MHLLASSALFAGLAAAKQCLNITVPITATGQNGVFNLVQPKTQIEAANFFLQVDWQGQDYPSTIQTGVAQVTGTYNISATYCYPDSGPSSVLQVLSHGVGWDKFYWDLAFNNFNYSYTSTAVDKYGYSTFAFDQIGVGSSSHPDPVNVVQGPMFVGVLTTITNLLRNGAMPGVKAHFDKIVHVGHSLGSFTAYGMTVLQPNITDGLILTSFSHNGSFVPEMALSASLGIASLVNPTRFGGLQGCYLVTQNTYGEQLEFFGPNEFDPDFLEWVFEQNSPIPCGLRLTIENRLQGPTNFSGPIQIVDGERDLLFCGGNCPAGPNGSSVPSTTAQFVLNSSNFTVDIVEGAGSALNIHYSAPTSYALIADFLKGNGLAPEPKRR